MRKSTSTFVTAFCLVGGFPLVGRAATLYVASNGVDHSACGAKADPCRSINQAIRNASDRDRIRVGPGIYTRATEGDPPSCFCLVRVNKAVSIESVGGAGVTIIDAQGLENGTVAIEADRAQFGRKNKGFLLRGGAFRGLRIASLLRKGIRVEGNRAQANGFDGFEVSGHDHVVANNEAIDNARSGFRELGGSNTTYKGNVATQNGGAGFEIAGDACIVTSNVASANGAEGFTLQGGGGHVVRRNTAVGNAGPGMLAKTADLTLVENNLFGNDAAGSNCGLKNDSGDPLPAKANYWGAATGPGGEPADDLCETSGTIDADPFAVKEFTVRPGAGR